ncbi:protein saal1 isoform X2 [Diorhabda carinulata]|uniref:protein saal1 isoform X2 n=1 Tax=Diorhabda carinulata TaxID=1163345 RepID=UPI0025A2FDE8|nr:protein saal1 isoform X2 [Diorhabda carinulata]
MENSIKECSNEQNPTNIDVTDLDEETVKKLRGDAIGDTLYSQSFVLKTLLKFSDLQWNDQVEEDLCFLWDMTVEKDLLLKFWSILSTLETKLKNFLIQL